MTIRDKHSGLKVDNHPVNNGSLSDLGEFGLIERIRSQVIDDDSVILGIGDDCSATTLPLGHVLLTSKDLLIEDVHFCRNWTDMYSLGRKSAAVNLSDIAAMGGIAHHLFLGVALPVDMSPADIDDFTRGFLAETAAAGATLCGGDTCRSKGALIISVTVQGSIIAEHLITRGGAQEGDLIYVSGTIGDSALALAQLQTGHQPHSFLAQRHHQPTPRLELGQQLAARKLAHAMIDISDGLYSDLGHILDQSHCGAVVDQRCIPLSEPVQKHLDNVPEDRDLVCRGGEDYELLFTVGAQRQGEIEQLSRQLGLALTKIGRITPAASGLQHIDADGNLQSISARGFNHFS
jgi:thiamine-monophosphate kinase